MRSYLDIRIACAAIFALSLPVGWSVSAQQVPELPAPSPHARVEQRVGVTDFSVDYSSPGVKGREIWGALVPYGELWRTGANRATVLEASKDFVFGGKPVSAGSYSLFTIPGKSEWTVILNSQADLPGTRGYDEAQDVARVKLTPTASPARERLTFLFSNTTDDATRLDLEWAELRVSIPIGVDTAAQVNANIDKAPPLRVGALAARQRRRPRSSARLHQYLRDDRADLVEYLGEGADSRQAGRQGGGGRCGDRGPGVG